MHSLTLEYIRDFNIPMNDGLPMQILQSQINIPNDRHNFLLTVLPMRMKLLLQVPILTKLSNDITITSTREDVLTFDDVRMVKLPKNFGFRVKEFMHPGCCEGGQLNHLDCNDLIYVEQLHLLVSSCRPRYTREKLPFPITSLKAKM